LCFKIIGFEIFVEKANMKNVKRNSILPLDNNRHETILDRFVITWKQKAEA